MPKREQSLQSRSQVDVRYETVVHAGGCKGANARPVQGALEWLEETQDKPLDEITKEAETAEQAPAGDEGGVANSLQCKECGKKFRGQAQAEFHASKSGHVDFEESTEEITPLTEEEKKVKLEELKQKLAEKRAGQSDQDKLGRKRNEVRLPWFIRQRGIANGP